MRNFHNYISSSNYIGREWDFCTDVENDALLLSLIINYQIFGTDLEKEEDVYSYPYVTL